MIYQRTFAHFPCEFLGICSGFDMCAVTQQKGYIYVCKYDLRKLARLLVNYNIMYIDKVYYKAYKYIPVKKSLVAILNNILPLSSSSVSTPTTVWVVSAVPEEPLLSPLL